MYEAIPLIRSGLHGPSSGLEACSAMVEGLNVRGFLSSAPSSTSLPRSKSLSEGKESKIHLMGVQCRDTFSIGQACADLVEIQPPLLPIPPSCRAKKEA